MNRGDAQVVVLNIRVNSKLAKADDFDEIEVTFNPELYGHSIRKLYSKNEIYWDAELKRFCLDLSQQETYILKTGENTWHLRVLIGGAVISTSIGKVWIGGINSKHALEVSPI